MRTMMDGLANGGGGEGRSGGVVVGEVKRGTKRDASDSGLDLSDFDRFEKRLRSLSLRSEYVPANKHATPTNPSPSTPSKHASRGNNKSLREEQHMHVDDTRDRVYISDLDAELAELDSDDADQDRLIFLPDIEQKLTRIPRQVLSGRTSNDNNDDDESGNGNQELVLYGIPGPSDGSEQQGHDAVRRAIIEARQRARDKSIETAREQESGVSLDGVIDGTHAAVNASDPDAMDIG